MAEANKLTNPSGSGCKVDLLADKNGGLIRMLGLELGRRAAAQAAHRGLAGAAGADRLQEHAGAVEGNLPEWRPWCLDEGEAAADGCCCWRMPAVAAGAEICLRGACE
eukprot:350411-Chlamydomonas_euryale.AAC.1